MLRGGDELMQIAPNDDDLIIEAKVNPTDVGQLRVGLPVSVKVDAFDYSVYGMLHGDLIYISPDTLSESGQSGQTQTYYRAKIRLPRLQAHNTKAYDIETKPGMTAHRRIAQRQVHDGIGNGRPMPAAAPRNHDRIAAMFGEDFQHIGRVHHAG